MVEFRKGSNCMAKFQFSEYGTLPTVGSVKSTATPGIANELKKTNPFASVPSKVSSGVLDPCNALFPVKRIGDVLSTPPVEAFGLAAVRPSVLAVLKPPKSGFAERLFPVIGKWDTPKPPRTTNDLFSRSQPKIFIFGLQANQSRGSNPFLS